MRSKSANGSCLRWISGALERYVRLGKLDTEVEQTIAARYTILSVLTLILFSKGNEIARQPGALSTFAFVGRTTQQVVK
jgi:thioredoxin 2